MTKRVCWKKGMRLTDDILRASDKCHSESLDNAFILASNGRFGLLPSSNGFNISVNINKNIIDIEALTCMAITKNGSVVDVNYDTTYTNNMDTRVVIPSIDEKSFLLVVQASDEWQETFDGFCVPIYKFVLQQENSQLGADMFPFARIINDYGWRLDELNFVPPCLFLSSHIEYVNQANQFKSSLNIAHRYLLDSLNSECKTAVSIFLPIVELLKITMDKDIELMTPMMLFGNIQKFISGFLCACLMDEKLNLSDADTFRNYSAMTYNYKEVYLRIKEGLELCNTVCEKVDKFKDFTHVEEKVAAPTISNVHLLKKCTNSKVKIPIENNCPGAVVYYTIDGSEPSEKSGTGNTIVFSSGFVGGKGKEEDDKIITVKVKAVMNGVCSVTNTYKVRLQKDIKHWIEI